MVATDLMRLDTQVTVPASIQLLPWDSTVMGLTAGERLSVRELLDGVFMRSGNDAAETLASAVTSRAAFVADMNAKAVRLGLHNTHFVNPTGLDAAGYTTTAYDLSVAATYLEYHYPTLTSIAAMPAGSREYTFVSTIAGNGVCSRSLEVTARGNGAAPKVISQTSGDCGAAGGARGCVCRDAR